MVWTMDTFENSVQRNCVDNYVQEQ